MAASLQTFAQSKYTSIRKNAILRLMKPSTEDAKEEVMMQMLKDEDAEVLHYTYNKTTVICEKNPDLLEAVVNQLVENTWIFPHSEAKARICLADVLILNEEIVPHFYDHVREETDFEIRFDMLMFLKYETRINNSNFEQFYKNCLFEVFQVYRNKKLMLEVFKKLDPTFDFYDFFEYLLGKFKDDIINEVEIVNYLKLEKTTNQTEKLISSIQQLLDVGGGSFVWIMNEILKCFKQGGVIQESFLYVTV